MDPKEITRSKKFKFFLFGIGFVVILLVDFGLGVLVGYKKANFSYKWEENYSRNFMGSRREMPGGMMGKDFTNASGIFGEIIKIDGMNLTINGQDGVEIVVVLKPDTAIRDHRNSVKSADLKVGEHITVIGSPNDAGQIEARFVRIMPADFSPPPLPLSTPEPAVSPYSSPSTSTL